ncbi:MAG: CRISPR-associated endonuclease Cas4g/Cas1g, partial [Terriglobales bacterium]
MSDAPLSPAPGFDLQPPLPLRRLHNYIYCPRLFYLQWVENIFQENADTVAGTLEHRNVDRPSRFAVPAGELELPEGTSIRSLRLESESLGLIGVVDIVEGGPDGAEVIDYKKGSARRNAAGERVAKDADAVQVAAQALLLRENGLAVSRAAVYYAADRRRVPVELSDDLFAQVRAAAVAARAVAASGRLPPPLRNDPRCLYCSAYPICLPKETAWWKEMPAEPSGGAPGQLQFGFVPSPPSAELRERLLAALDFAAESTGGSTAAPPAAAGDEGELLIVQRAGAQVGQRGEQIVVSERGEELRKLPARQVRAIYLYGAVQLTAQAAESCLELGISVARFSAAGRFLGLLTGLPASGVDARRAQYRLFELDSVRLLLAREVIRAKIHNQRVMLMRNGQAPPRVLSLLAQLRDAAASAGSAPDLLGFEGEAAALYFEQFASMLHPSSGWDFDWRGRNRRPPRDPVNALLSLGYSMLAKELTGVCYAVGLDPFLGFLHQPRYGRPALALDLMEEFRALTTDSVAISLVNRGELGPEDFLRAASGTFLNEHGRKAFWEAWFRRLDAGVTHPEFGYRMAYRRMFEIQARQMWRFLRGEA